MEKNYVFQCTEATSKKGSKYYSMSISNGVEKRNVYWWNPLASSSPRDFIHKVINCSIEEKNGYFSIDSKIIVSEMKDEPEISQLRKLKVVSDITPEQLIHAVEKCVEILEVGIEFKEFLEFIKYKEMIIAYGRTPAALSVHHAIEGGLIQHMYEMMSLYYNMTKTSVVRGMRHEFVIIGILFHDYGKCFEYNLDEWKETVKRALLGHIYISANHLQTLIEKYNSQAVHKISDSDKDLMVHCVLAHHKNKEWGSPVTPAIKEALILHYVDIISGDSNQFDNATHMEQSKFLGTQIVKDY